MEIEHENTQNIVCPYCGYEDPDSWEFKGEIDVYEEYECENCENTFEVMMEFQVAYTSRKIKNDKRRITVKKEK